MTSTIGISDVIGRVQQIEQQLQQLQSGQLLNSMLGISGSGGVAATGAPESGASNSFSSALAAAQTTSGTSVPAGLSAGALSPNVAAITQTGSPPVASTSLGVGAPGGTGALGAGSFGAGSFGAGSVGSGSLATVTGGVGIGGAALPPAAGTMLTSAQQQFASTLAAETGLNPGVVSAWLLAEENGGAAQARQAAGNNDWLNIGYTDSGTYGAADTVWANPVTAANATAQWLRGQASIPGYGAASSGIQAILQTVGQSPQAQIAALQGSGWASSGYPDLAALYTQVTGA